MLPNFLFFVAFDGEKRRGQVEIKLSLKSQLVNYPRNSYCESELIYENCHVDYIYPANRGELKIIDNIVLIYWPYNLSKSADSLKSFAKRNHLNYDKIITRLIWGMSQSRLISDFSNPTPSPSFIPLSLNNAISHLKLLSFSIHKDWIC